MKTSSRKALLFPSIVLPLALGIQAANAVEITEWEYDVVNSFSNVTESGGEGSVVVSGPNDNILTWGTETESSVSVTPSLSNPPLLETNGPELAGGTFTHNNQVIDADDSALTGFDLTTTITLTPFTPPGPSVEPLSLVFDSFFTETFNFDDNDDCVPGSLSNCDDIFSVGNAAEIGDIVESGNLMTSQSFTIDDYNYTLFFEVQGLGPLTDAQCAEADAPSGCIGFLTQEGQNNEFTSTFSIVSSPVSVPEPGTLALLGLGLVGLGVARRKTAKV